MEVTHGGGNEKCAKFHFGKPTKRRSDRLAHNWKLSETPERERDCVCARACVIEINCPRISPTVRHLWSGKSTFGFREWQKKNMLSRLPTISFSRPMARWIKYTGPLYSCGREAADSVRRCQDAHTTMGRWTPTLDFSVQPHDGKTGLDIENGGVLLFFIYIKVIDTTTVIM